MTQNKLLNTYKYLYALASIFEIFWGVYMLNAPVSMNYNEVFVLRIIGSVVLFIGFISTLNEDFFENHIVLIANIVLYTMIIQRYVLLYFNPESWTYIIDLYTVCVLAMVTFPSRESTITGGIAMALPAIYFPAHEYTAFWNIVTVAPLIGTLKWVFFDAVEMLKKMNELEKNASLLDGFKATITNISHDVNNALMKISLQSDMLDNEPVQVSIKSYISEITELFRSFQETMIEEYEKKELRTFLPELVEEHKKKINNAGVSCNILLDGDCNFDVCELPFKQVMKSIVDNAIYELKGKENPTIDIITFEDKEYFYLKIADNANTLKKEDMHLIFKPFFTKKTINEGSKGLGLSFAKNNCRILNASLSVDIGDKTTFVLKIEKNYDEQEIIND